MKRYGKKTTLALKISTIRYLSLRIIKWYNDVEIVELEQQHGSGPDVTNIRQIDKDFKALWPFTYRIVNESRETIQVVDRNPDNLLMKWIPDTLTPKECIKRLIKKRTGL